MNRYDTLASEILSSLQSWAEDGASPKRLRGYFADYLTEELPEVAIVERLAQVYTVDTDQAALIQLVHDAKQAVAR